MIAAASILIAAGAALTGGFVGFGVAVDVLLGSAAAIGAISVIWQKALSPAIGVLRAAAAAVGVLRRFDDSFADLGARLGGLGAQLEAHHDELDERVTRLEGQVDAVLRRP